MDATPVAVLLWFAAAAGAVAATAAVRLPGLRRVLLVVAAILFLPIGILGILSVGALFLAAAAVCLVAAVRWRPVRDDGSHTSLARR